MTTEILIFIALHNVEDTCIYVCTHVCNVKYWNSLKRISLPLSLSFF